MISLLLMAALMGGGSGRTSDVPESYWSMFEAGWQEPEKPVCAHCGNPSKDEGEKCPGCGSREVVYEQSKDS